MTYDTYVFILCSIVYVLMTAISIFVVWTFTRMSIRLIRCGADDKKIIKEYVKTHGKRRKKGILDIVVSLVFVVIFSVAFAFSLYVNVNQDAYFNNVPTLKVVNSASMAKKHEKNTYLTENNLNNQFQTFDLVLTYKAPAQEDLQLYDVVVYKIDKYYVIHRIVAIEEPNEKHPEERYFRLQGDAVESPDREWVKYSQICAIYRGEKIPFAGSFVTFLQSPAGWMCMILLVVAIVFMPLVEKKIEKEKKERLYLLGEKAMKERLRQRSHSPKRARPKTIDE